MDPPRSSQFKPFIRVVPKAACFVKVCAHNNFTPISSIREKDGPLLARLTANDWLLVEHSRLGVGLVGLPFEGTFGSWKAAWDDNQIDLELCIKGVWQKPMEEWVTLTSLGMNL